MIAEYRDFHLDTPRWSAWDVVQFCGLVACSLMIGCLALNITVTRPYWRPDLGLLDRKLEALRSMKDQVDLVFLGTSRINQGIEPDAFDESAQSEGISLNSFNLGVEDMKCQEYWICLDELSRMQLPRLKWVVIEPTLNMTPPPGQWMTARVRYFSRWETLLPGVQAKWGAQRPLVRRLEAVTALLTGYVVHAANLGVLSDLHLPQATNRNQEAEVQPIVRGGPAEQSTAEEDQKRVRRYASERARPGFAFPTLPDPPGTVPDAEVRIQKIALNRIDSLGAKPVWLLPPQMASLDLMRASEAAAETATPEVPCLKYYFGTGPQSLYENPDFWRDKGHLSLEGARVFSALLAHDLRDFLKGK